MRHKLPVCRVPTRMGFLSRWYNAKRFAENVAVHPLSAKGDAEQIVHQVSVSKYVGNHRDSANFEYASSDSGEEGTICSSQKGKRGRTRLGHLDVGEDRSIALAEKDMGCTSVDDEVIQG